MAYFLAGVADAEILKEQILSLQRKL